MTVFVDSSVWFAATANRDANNELAQNILASAGELLTSDHVLVETWLLLNSRHSRPAAENFWKALRQGAIPIEKVTEGDLEAAWNIGMAYADQTFSIADRTSFALMERLGIERVASFDRDFAIYRYGRNKDRAFEIVRAGHSETFRLFHRAILEMKQIVCTYQGMHREVCPIILGHKDGVEKALVFQFGGQSSRGLARGDWKCFELEHVESASMRDGPWHAGDSHQTRQRCVDDVFIDVNLAVPNQPGRRRL